MPVNACISFVLAALTLGLGVGFYIGSYVTERRWKNTCNQYFNNFEKRIEKLEPKRNASSRI